MSKEKSDATLNGSKVQQSVAAQLEREKNLVPLRIDSQTVIMVKSENNNDAYAQKFRAKAFRKPEVRGVAVFE